MQIKQQPVVSINMMVSFHPQSVSLQILPVGSFQHQLLGAVGVLMRQTCMRQTLTLNTLSAIQFSINYYNETVLIGSTAQHFTKSTHSLALKTKCLGSRALTLLPRQQIVFRKNLTASGKAAVRCHERSKKGKKCASPAATTLLFLLINSSFYEI